MKERILINPELCDGCGICELVCAAAKTGQWHPALACIRVINDARQRINLPVVCAHCENPPCAEACLMNVIAKDPVSGWTVRQETNCIGCHACQLGCPFGASCFNYINEVVLNCDLCNGEPVCVQYCPTGALVFENVADAAARKRQAAAGMQLQLLGKGDEPPAPCGGTTEE